MQATYHLLGCGILKKEIQWLIAQNQWPLDPVFFDSTLHCDFHKLGKTLAGALHRHGGEHSIVFYGECHPCMEDLLRAAHTLRTPGQNCLEILLGKERFNQELAAGAFFLLEAWVHHWQRMMALTFGPHPHIMREIFQLDRTCLLAVRTPCSGDFTHAAEEISRSVGLPMRWMDVGLEHLEAVLRQVLAAKQAEPP